MTSKNILIFIILVFICSIVYSQDFAYKNANLPIPERVINLLNQMTWEEKLVQTYCILFEDDLSYKNGIPELSEDLEKIIHLGVGQIGKPLLAYDQEPKKSAEITNFIQKKVIEGNRFGIPAIFHEEALHGLWARCQ